MLVNGEGIIAGHGFREHQSLNCGGVMVGRESIARKMGREGGRKMKTTTKGRPRQRTQELTTS